MEEYRYCELTAYEQLELAIHNILSIGSALRPIDQEGVPGGLLEFPENDTREVLVIGDLHANKKNLRAILMDDKNIRKLRENKAILLFLGDAVHDDRVGHMQEMDTSIQIMDIIIHLINIYPQNVFYLLGNHDTFEPRLAKANIKQGVLYRNAVVKKRGQKYAELMKLFFSALPIFFKHPHLLAVHAGPVRGVLSKDVIINIRYTALKDYLWQFTWNRINETRSSPSKKEYSEEELVNLRNTLNSPSDIPIIVGHNTLWRISNEDCVWVNVAGSKNHVVLYCTLEEKATYLSFKNTMKYKIKHANLKIQKSKFLLG